MKKKPVNKIKMILVHKCGECWHYMEWEQMGESILVCGRVNHETIIDLNKLPGWCPLPDAPKDPRG